MSLQALLDAGLPPQRAQAITQTLSRNGILTVDDAYTLAWRMHITRARLVADARADWWLNPAIPMEYKRLLDAKAGNVPDNSPLLGLTPAQAAERIVSSVKSSGQRVDHLLPALYRLWAEARDRYLSIQEDDGTLPPDVSGHSWAEICALYVKLAENGHPEHPAQVLGQFLGAVVEEMPIVDGRAPAKGDEERGHD